MKLEFDKISSVYLVR